MSPNVRLSLIFSFLAGVGRGVWSFTVLSGYLFVLTGSNAKVGIAEGVQGIAQLVVALGAGAIITYYKRSDKVLWLAAVVGLVAAGGLIFALSVHGATELGEHRFLLVTAGLGLFGSYQGVWNTALETIFADSIPSGHRDEVNTQKFNLTLLSSVSGPLLANMYMYTFGTNDW